MVWVIRTEGGRIRLTGKIDPRAAWEIITRRVPISIEMITILGLWIILLTVGVWVLLTGDHMFPGTIHFINIVPLVNIFAARNALVKPDYHPQVRQVVHGG